MCLIQINIIHTYIIIVVVVIFSIIILVNIIVLLLSYFCHYYHAATDAATDAVLALATTSTATGYQCYHTIIRHPVRRTRSLTVSSEVFSDCVLFFFFFVPPATRLH